MITIYMNKIKLFRRMSSPSLQKISWLKIQRIQSFHHSMAHLTTNNWGSKLVSRWQWGQHWYITYGDVIFECVWFNFVSFALCTINMWWVSKFSQHQNNTEASRRWEDKTSISLKPPSRTRPQVFHLRYHLAVVGLLIFLARKINHQHTRQVDRPAKKKTLPIGRIGNPCSMDHPKDHSLFGLGLPGQICWNTMKYIFLNYPQDPYVVYLPTFDWICMVNVRYSRYT